MNASKLVELWDRFFYRQVPAYSLGLFRIAFGVVIFVAVALIWPDATVWYGERGVLPSDVAGTYLDPPRLDVLLLLHQSDVVVHLFMGFTLLAAAALIAGFHTRVASVAVWACLVSLHHRDLFILNAGDHLMRTLSFFLMFAPADKAYSLDRCLRTRRGVEPPGIPFIEIWPQRLLQIQVWMMYVSTVMLKSGGQAWYDGTSVYYVTHLAEFHRFPLPEWMQTLWFSQIATWATVAIEISLATLIWVPRFRKYVLCGGILLHLGMEYMMNIPVFQWVVLSSYIVFLQDFPGFRKLWGRELPNEADLAADHSTVPLTAVARRTNAGPEPAAIRVAQ